MQEMIAYCGITCSECPACLATQRDDAQELERVAEMWSSEDLQVKPEHIVCEGCLPGHTRYALFCSDCQARACAIVRGMQNCAYCDDFPCDKLMVVFQMAPEAKAKLEAIRAGL